MHIQGRTAQGALWGALALALSLPAGARAQYCAGPFTATASTHHSQGRATRSGFWIFATYHASCCEASCEQLPSGSTTLWEYAPGCFTTQDCSGAQGCALPSSPMNGHVTTDCTDVGCTASYVCDAGYVLGGDASRQCQSDGLWSGSTPSCLAEADCGVPASPANGTASAPCTTLGCTASYVCAPGYVLSGDVSRQCQSDGLWSGTTPSCQPVGSCPSLAPPVHGGVSVPCADLGCTAQYSCDAGYVATNGGSRTCQLGHTWSGAPPACLQGVFFAPAATDSNGQTRRIWADSASAAFVNSRAFCEQQGMCFVAYDATGCGTAGSSFVDYDPSAGVWASRAGSGSGCQLVFESISCLP